MDYFFEYINIFIISLGYYYGINRLEILDNNKKDFLLFTVINSLSVLLSSIVIANNLQIYINVISLFFCIFLIFKIKLKKSFFITLFLEVYSVLFEIVLSFLLFIISYLFKVISFDDICALLNENFLLSFFINGIFSLSMFYIFKNSFIKSFYNKVVEYKSEKNGYRIIICILISLFLITFLYYVMFKTGFNLIIFILFIILIVLVIYVAISNVNIIVNYNDTKTKYDESLNSLSKYEEIIDKYRISNHENKNQLQMIRTMIKQKDKNVDKYIDQLLDNVYMENEKLFMNLSILPSGIRATVYTKLVTMDNKNIEYVCNIDRQLRTNFKISDKIALKVCNIISVFIDNAIEEVEDKSQKKVYIEFYFDNKNNSVLVEISNPVENININNFYHKGFTTKSNGHGYGLVLAKEIVESEEVLENRYRVKDDIFTQVLEIKIKRWKINVFLS